MTVHDDMGDGVDVRLSDGRLINVLARGLDEASASTRIREDVAPQPDAKAAPTRP
ncbi:hypothetical protein [Streptomyces spectabilis]|uniref:hypothetical protein n=1 Tax=Streptomyces spectabilis TaxID=68270 RepID=UPI001378CB91|nr:hypothetical protein [Streptomyces spectabilis]